jgi:hypothetical protein
MLGAARVMQHSNNIGFTVYSFARWPSCGFRSLAACHVALVVVTMSSFHVSQVWNELATSVESRVNAITFTRNGADVRERTSCNACRCGARASRDADPGSSTRAPG